MLQQMPSMDLPLRTLDDLQYFALEGAPYEVCGVIHPHNIVHQYQNTLTGDRTCGFDMEVDIHDKQSIKAVWHSHPGGSTVPSDIDISCMRHLAEHGFSFPWVIVTSKEVTYWLYSLVPSV